MIVIDANQDYWTCDRPRVSGVWCTEKFVALTSLRAERCRRVNPAGEVRCVNCHKLRGETA